MGILIENPGDLGRIGNLQLTAGSLGSKNSYKNVHIYIINKGNFKLIK